MVIMTNECKHCGSEYMYQASGFPHPEIINDKEYCPVCAEAIQKALSKIPRKFEWRYVHTKDLTKQQALEIIEKRDDQSTEGFPPIRRIFPELFDPKTNEWSRTEEFYYKDSKYMITYWKNKPKKYAIYKWERKKIK